MSKPILLDELLKSQLILERFKPDAIDITNEALLKARDNIISRIVKTQSDREFARLRDIQKTIDAELSKAYSNFYDDIMDDYTEAAALGYDSTNSILNEFAALEATPLAFVFDKLPKAAVNRILDERTPLFGSTLKDHALNQQHWHNKRLRESLAAHIFDGDSTQRAQQTARMVENVDEIFGKATRHEINTVVRTAIQAAFSRANDEVFRQHSSLIIGFRQISVLDGRTSRQCAALSQMFYPVERYPTIDDVPDRPPGHPNCRRMIVPETRLSRKLQGERPYAIHDDRIVKHRDGSRSTKFTVKKTGTVKGNTSFSKWFGTQDKSSQVDYLGKTRYEWYRDGKISITELYDRQRRKVLTIPEIRAKLKI